MIVDSTTLVFCIPLLYLLAALAAWLIKDASRAWAFAQKVALYALIVGAFAAASGVFQSISGGSADAIGLILVLLIGLLGWVIVRYSRSYLHGEQEQRRYIVAMMLTLAAVVVVASAQHLGVLIAAWIASSLSLHHLLTFYRNRRPAQIVAHKKFLASRLAEICLLAAVVLLYTEIGTLSLAAISEQVSSHAQLPWTLHMAAALIALAVILKSAQLPVHGWLIQVMEAPTPVSALLHAGIVNLGGFVLIRLAVLFSAAPIAQAILVIIGSLTAVLAGLVMMTRISIKVRLAWSTCAQMGFMLMECGLGLYDLAFLHLVSHSLYKAYAFLRAGECVLDFKRNTLLPAVVPSAPAATLLRNLFAAPLSVSVVALSLHAWQLALPQFELSSVATLILGLGFAPLLWTTVRHTLRGLLTILALTQLYSVWHLLFSAIVAQPDPVITPALAVWVCGLFAMFFAVQAWLSAYPHGRLSQTLYPWVYHGFYLDERFTRLTFRVWPVRLPVVAQTSLTAISLHHPLPGENV